MAACGDGYSFYGADVLLCQKRSQGQVGGSAAEVLGNAYELGLGAYLLVVLLVLYVLSQIKVRNVHLFTECFKLELEVIFFFKPSGVTINDDELDAASPGSLGPPCLHFFLRDICSFGHFLFDVFENPLRYKLAKPSSTSTIFYIKSMFILTLLITKQYIIILHNINYLRLLIHMLKFRTKLLALSTQRFPVFNDLLNFKQALQVFIVYMLCL